ncbi:MAG: transcriptional repressor [Rhodobacteraceae bacterium]|nr:transcriptional repressor [Paracoccaceae bacterium]
MPTIGFDQHDHGHCMKHAMLAAENRCAKAKLQFTPVRKRVLEILLEKHMALGAYDILNVLTADGLGSQPPVVYRALDFLVSNGLAHRIERLNAYTACSHMDHAHAPAFLICRICRTVAETELEQERLATIAKQTGFTIERIVIEAEGLCPTCAVAEA